MKKIVVLILVLALTACSTAYCRRRGNIGTVNEGFIVNKLKLF